MELWLIITITTFIAALLAYLSLNSKKLPPGPQYIPLITIIIWLRRSFVESQAALRALSSKFGPIVTLSSSASRPVIYIFNRALAYEALVHKGILFADRPKPLLIANILSSNQHIITLARYGPLWRLLRRNLTSMILHPSQIKDFGWARKWVLHILLNRLRTSADAGAIKVVDHFQFAMFHLLVVMCLGDNKMEESQIKEIKAAFQELLGGVLSRFRVLNFFTQVWVTRILFRNRWNEFHKLKKKQEEILIPYIRAQIEKTRDDKSERSCYLDTLLRLEIPCTSGKRKLSEKELVSLCFEFINAGTDTTSTTLQWIMANLVKYPNIQAKLFEEIQRVIGEEETEVEEDALSKMPYLKAVILEGLRRHPPGHFVLPHGVTQEAELGGYTIPKNASINFAVAEIGWDPEVWEDPMIFKPERFTEMIKESDINDEEFDSIGFGSHEIKMMPFGVGRRICPGRGLALLHLEYFVANLVLNFEWKAIEGDEVDLSEKQEFTIVMKYPLHAHISPRKFN